MQKTQNTRQIDKKNNSGSHFYQPPVGTPHPSQKHTHICTENSCLLEKKLPLHSDTFQVPFATDENLTLLASSPCLMDFLTCNGAAGKGRKTTGIMGKNVRFKVGTSVVAFLFFVLLARLMMLLLLKMMMMMIRYGGNRR